MAKLLLGKVDFKLQLITISNIDQIVNMCPEGLIVPSMAASANQNDNLSGCF